MTLVAVIPLLVTVLSALVYLLVTRADVRQLAIYSYLAAMIALMLSVAGHVVRLGVSP